MIHILWAFNGWTNKDWLFQEMLRSGLSQIQGAFQQLLYGQTPLAERFDLVKKKVRMMGTACVSEVLAHHDHVKYPIWNSRRRRGLIALGIDETRLPKSSQISGAQYATSCDLVKDESE